MMMTWKSRCDTGAWIIFDHGLLEGEHGVWTPRIDMVLFQERRDTGV